jgi:Flp pilus assembly protein TadB
MNSDPGWGAFAHRVLAEIRTSQQAPFLYVALLAFAAEVILGLWAPPNPARDLAILGIVLFCLVALVYDRKGRSTRSRKS